MSVNYFARHIGLARGENIYQIKRGNNGISLKLADCIVRAFPEINKLWLLTGEGEMYLTKEEQAKPIPFYEMDVRIGLAHIDHLEPTCMLTIPMFHCDLAMLDEVQLDDSPRLDRVVLLMKQVDPKEPFTPNRYAIRTRKGAMLRHLSLNETGDRIVVAPAVTGGIEQSLAVDEVLALYAVHATLAYNL